MSQLYIDPKLYITRPDAEGRLEKEIRVYELFEHLNIFNEFIGCHPCINTSSLKIKTSDLLDKFLPYIKHEPIIVNL